MREPVAGHPLFRTEGRDDLQEALHNLYGVSRVAFAPEKARSSSKPSAVANRAPVHDVVLHYCRYDAPVEIDFPAMAGYRQMFRLSGAGRLRGRGWALGLDADHTGVIAPHSAFSAHYDDGYAQLVLQFDQAALLRKNACLSGGDGAPDLRIAAFTPRAVREAWRARSIALLLAEHLAEMPIEPPSGPADAFAPVMVELTEALASAFLIANQPPSARPRTPLGGAVGRRDLDRLEDYIQAHWDQPLTVEAVAAACGVSVRAVYAQFKARRGMSPNAYIRDLRLTQARRRLQTGGREVSVMSVALQCGFASFGHFARRYQAKFGEYPSETLRPPLTAPGAHAPPR